MSFQKAPQVYSSSINELTIGTGAGVLTLGGENVLPLYTFDAPIAHRPAVGIEVSDIGYRSDLPELAAFYEGADTLVAQAQRAAELEGVDFVSLSLVAGDPNGENRPVDELVEEAKAVEAAIDKPLVIEGCHNIDKDEQLFSQVAEALQGKNVLFLSAREENYKTVGAAVGLAYGQKLGCESSVDINLAKQLNVLVTQLGVSPDSMVMNLGSAAVGYGYEYVASTLDRVKLAALEQNDSVLQLPIVTPVGSEAWAVKESIVSQDDFPEWGPVEKRGIEMEIATAAASLAGGSNAVILMHPQSVRTISEFITELM